MTFKTRRSRGTYIDLQWGHQLILRRNIHKLPPSYMHDDVICEWNYMKQGDHDDAWKSPPGTVFSWIWQPCWLWNILPLDCLAQNICICIRSMFLSSLAPKICEKVRIWQPWWSNLATLFVGHFSKCHHLIPWPQKHRYKNQQHSPKSIRTEDIC